jgi:NAD(P)-dependent dehydrogenase (short-subunit alcohol dehydrogenase family)
VRPAASVSHWLRGTSSAAGRLWPPSGSEPRHTYSIFLEASDGRLEIETVDIIYPDQVAAVRARLASRKFDLLFVNTGVTNDDRETIADVSTDESIRVMITNGLSSMRVVETLQVFPVSTSERNRVFSFLKRDRFEIE